MRCSNAKVLGTPHLQGHSYKMPLGRQGSTPVWGTAEISRQDCVAPSKAPDGAPSEITPIKPPAANSTSAPDILACDYFRSTPPNPDVFVSWTLYTLLEITEVWKKEIKQSVRHTWTSDLKQSVRVQGLGRSYLGTQSTSFHLSSGLYLLSI